MGVRIGWFLLTWTFMLDGCDGKPHTPIHGSKTQLVTVVSEDWNAFEAEMRRYQRAPGKSWTQVGEPIAVVLGREGYGWGRGRHGEGRPRGRPGPLKREGDGRSPAGVFDVGTAYGYPASRDSISLPYLQATPSLRCVDDPASRHYNRIVSTDSTPVDWKSAEHMRRDDELYAIAIVVEHNTGSVQLGAGSCIFIHAWKGPGIGMSGCTAMPMEALESLADWLKPGASALVALPHQEYAALREAWALP